MDLNNTFIIMHQNKVVATIDCEGKCVILSETFMPYNLYFDVDETTLRSRISNLNNFYNWCSSRLLTLDRKYAKEILNSLGKKQAVTDRDRAEIALTYHCLSLTDVYWVRAESEEITFDEINLYENSLSNSFVDVSLCGKQLTAQNAELVKDSDVAGDIGTPGLAPKAWIRENGEFFLLKDGDLRDVNAELLASKIIGCFDIDYVPYIEEQYDGKKVTSCKIITSVDRSIVPMEHVEIYAANHDFDKLDFVRQIDSYSYYMMNVVDYLIGNTDRHWANWGLLFDNKNNTPIKLHPLMDFNKSFMSYDIIDGSRCQTVNGNVSQMDAAIDAVKHIGLNQKKEVNPEWFDSSANYEMFKQRLNLLKAQCDRV